MSRDYLKNSKSRKRLLELLKIDKPLRPMSKPLQDKFCKMNLPEIAEMDIVQARANLKVKLIEMNAGMTINDECSFNELIEIFENVVEGEKHHEDDVNETVDWDNE